MPLEHRFQCGAGCEAIAGHPGGTSGPTQVGKDCVIRLVWLRPDDAVESGMQASKMIAPTPPFARAR